jgi:hypothetical protein
VSLANALVEEILDKRPIPIEHHLESLKVIDNLTRWRAMAKEELQEVNPGFVTVR